MDDKYSAFFRCEPVFVEDMQRDPRVQYPKAAAKEGLVSLLSLPLVIRKAVIGLIRMYHLDYWDLHDEDLDLLCVMQRLLAVVIENNGLRIFLEQVKLQIGNLPPRMLA